MLNNDRTVYLNGCSYTYGTDSVPNIKFIDKKNNDYAFGNFLKAKRVINDSHPGSSNMGIFTRTIDWFERNTGTDMAILCWTSFYRVSVPCTTRDSIDRLNQHVLKNFEHYEINEDVMKFQTVSMILALDAYLQQKGIVPYHVWAFDCITHNMLDCLRDRWLWYNDSWAGKKNMKLVDKKTHHVYHPTLDAHKQFAQDLTEFINGQN